jgi:hypothetical protein
MATSPRAEIQELLEKVLSTRSVIMGYIDRTQAELAKGLRVGTTDTRVEVGSNTSTMTLRVVGGDEKGSLKCETVKSGRESQGART